MVITNVGKTFNRERCMITPQQVKIKQCLMSALSSRRESHMQCAMISQRHFQAIQGIYFSLTICVQGSKYPKLSV